MTYKEYEEMVDVITNQVIFTNSLGETEYHPERLEMLLGYFYLKNMEHYTFEKDYDFSLDIASMEYYEELRTVVDGIKIKSEHIAEWSNAKLAVVNKVEFEKQKYLKRDNYSLTDAYLAGFLDKLSDWIEDKGIEKLLMALSKTGDEIGGKNV